MRRTALGQTAFFLGVAVLSALSFFGFGWSHAGTGLRVVGVLSIAAIALGGLAWLSGRPDAT